MYLQRNKIRHRCRMQENVQYKPRDGKYNVETRNAIVIRTRANPEGMQREGERERKRENGKEDGRKQRGRHVRERKGRDNTRKTALPRCYYEKINFLPERLSFCIPKISRCLSFSVALRQITFYLRNRWTFLPPRLLYVYFMTHRIIKYNDILTKISRLKSYKEVTKSSILSQILISHLTIKQLTSI